ncbi:conserved hypothetical protein [Nitrosomonas nitrosa]|uniref:Uncharacterized protein n=1 Tax=Nitrosomonas nitrosa TaxID=52442 RepID=A0A8H8YY64_9PROT|nr:hypothetical protein [Nitrosomonas nitrosa]CAE6495738.1 conserved hypothetical protein [Nitrosomonas nitrosa]
MSRLWRDQIQIFFAPGRVDMVRTFRGIKPKQSPKIATNSVSQQDAIAWNATLRQLEQMVEMENASSSLAGAEMSVTLSNHFVRYALVPPQPEITEPAELLAFAHFHMREVYGERVENWMVSLSEGGPDKGVVSAAIERDLYQALEALSLRHRIKLKQIEPYLTAAFDQWCTSFDDKRLWFVVIEPGRLCIVLISNGNWQSIRNQRVVRTLEDELFASLEQEVILSGHREPVERVYLCAPEHANLALPADREWQFVFLPNSKIPAPRHFPSILARRTDYA